MRSEAELRRARLLDKCLRYGTDRAITGGCRATTRRVPRLREYEMSSHVLNRWTLLSFDF